MSLPRTSYFALHLFIASEIAFLELTTSQKQPQLLTTLRQVEQFKNVLVSRNSNERAP